MTKHRATPWFGTLRAIFIIRILSFLASILANLCSSPCLHIPVITDRHCSLFRFLRVTVALDEGQEIVFALRHLKPAKTSPSDRGKREEERMTTKEQSFANFLLIVYRASAFILFVWRNSFCSEKKYFVMGLDACILFANKRRCARTERHAHVNIHVRIFFNWSYFEDPFFPFSIELRHSCTQQRWP